MRRLPVATLALSHLAADLNQGALPALLPLLISQRHLSYSIAAGLVMSMTAMSSFLQPVFGWAADRRPTSWLAPLGLLVSGISMAATGILGSYFGLILAVALSGLGLAAFHPEGARLVHQYSGQRLLRYRLTAPHTSYWHFARQRTGCCSSAHTRARCSRWLPRSI